MQDITKKLKILTIEGTNNCNFNCCFCPHFKMERKKGIMPFETFKKIIDEVKEWNLQDLSLTGFGEPLLDPDIFKKVEYARTNMPKSCIIEFNTNASLLDFNKFKKLISAGLDELRISSYSTNESNFKKIHGVNCFVKTHENIINFKKIKNDLVVKKPIISMGFLKPPESPEEKSTWFKFWKNSMDKFYSESGEIHNFSNGLDYNSVRKTKRLSCQRPFTMGQILWNGDVCICCADYEGKVVFGNVNNMTLGEIMNSLQFKKMLDIHNKKKFELIPLCDECDQLVPANLRNILARFKFNYLQRRYAGK